MLGLSGGMITLFQNFSSVQAKSVRATGQLETVIEDYRSHSVTRHFLKTDKGRLELKLKGKELNLQTGATLEVLGNQTGNILELNSVDNSTVSVVAAAPLPGTAGEQRVAVLLVNFLDNASQPFTLAQAQESVFTQVNNFMKENSFQKTWLTGNSFGWWTLQINATCNGSDIANAAKLSAAAVGVDLSVYNRIIYIHPPISTCGWSGVGTLGGNPSESWINGGLGIKVISHELGHNFGLQHSHSLDCDLSPLGTTCVTMDYGDVADTMGSTTSSHFNSFQKERLGWLGDTGQPTMAIAASSGTYNIDTYEVMNTNSKTLKILKSTDALTGAKTWYYIEYRQPIGFDQELATLYGSNLVSGVIIRMGTDGDRNSSYILDMTPGTIPTFDMGDAALTLGRTFSDSVAGVSVTLLSMNANGASVSVTLSPPECVPQKPSLAIAPDGLWGSPGQTLSYTVSVGNNDPSSCATSTFDVVGVVPTGWAQSHIPFSVTLAPGAQITKSVSVTSPANAVVGSYNAIQESVSRGSDLALSVSRSINYFILYGPIVDTTAPVTVITNPTNGNTVPTKSTVTITANTTDNVGIQKVEFLVNGRLTCTSYSVGISSCTWLVPRAIRKTYSLQTRAFDNAGNVGFSPIVKVTSN